MFTISVIKKTIISSLISIESEPLCGSQLSQFKNLHSSCKEYRSENLKYLLLLSLLLLLPPTLTNICQKYPWSITISTTFLILFRTLAYSQRSSNGTRKGLVILFAIRSKRGFPTSPLGRDFQLANQFVSQREPRSERIRQLIFRDKFIDGRYSRPDAASNVSKAAITRSSGEWFHRTLQPTQPSF